MMARSIITLLFLLVVNLLARPSIARNLPANYADPILNGLAVALIVAGAFFLDRLIRRFYWTGYLKRRRNRETPALIQDIVTILILASALAIGLRINAGLTLTGILTASGAVAFVLGIALQPVIQDLFSGLSINFDGSYALGDWLTLYSDQMPEPIYGCVSGITWRTTFLRLEDGRRLMIPNRLMSTNPVMNHSRPHEAKRLSVEIAIDIRVPTNRVIDMLLGEAFKAARLHGLVRTPPPDIVISRVDADTTFYEVRFYALPDQINPGSARSAMLRALLDVVQQNDLPLPVTQVEMTKPPNLKLVLGEQEVSEALCRVNLFANALN
ncbi:MAG TPA: mechanosensitive ion channel family protein, partial [Rhizomicrobium sp.]